MAFNDAAALSEITIFTEAATFPILSTSDLALLLTKARRVDDSNRPPSDPKWVPTYNLAFAISLGWKMKAGRLILKTDVQDSDQKISRSQMYKQAIEQMRWWKRQSQESIKMQGAWRRRAVLGSTIPGVQSNGVLEDDFFI